MNSSNENKNIEAEIVAIAGGPLLLPYFDQASMWAHEPIEATNMIANLNDASDESVRRVLERLQRALSAEFESEIDSASQPPDDPLAS